MMRGFKILAVAVLVFGFGFIFWGAKKSGAPESGGEKISAVTSFYPLYFFAERIGGDKVNVFNITPAGAEPHDYEPTARDIAQIEDSDLLILNGGGLESWGDSARKIISPERTQVLAVSEGLVSRQFTDEDGRITPDPHVWLSPIAALEMIQKIEDGFIKVDEKNARLYAENADTLKAEIRNLDLSYRQGLSDCGERSFVTSHAAFGYLAADYNLNQIPIAGFSPGAEPSPKEIAAIADFVKEKGIEIIFFESLVSPKLSQTIAQETGVRTLALNPIEGLTKDEISAGRNYFTEMKENLSNLEIALKCKK